MPYIEQEARHALSREAEDWRLPETAGELNYTFYVHALSYIERKGKSYQTINDIVGALEGAKLEFYRRIAAPYEDEKKKQNGDVC